MRLATSESEAVRGSTYPNPPVGAVILDAAGDVVGRGGTRPTGGPHAEIIALRQAGPRARGGTAVVTLEPCDHIGRTGPCSLALIDAGVSAVVYAVGDPNPAAAGGAATMRAAGIDVTAGIGTTAVTEGPLRAWLHRQRTGRPHITWKLAASLDGRTAAADGSSAWITGSDARSQVHVERAKIDAIIVGTGTVVADNPRLTARREDGGLAPHQPLRVVIGFRELDRASHVFDDSAPTLVLKTHDPDAVVLALHECTDILIEGGPVVAAAFLRAGLVDRILAYIAPALIGRGPSVTADFGVGTIAEALRFRREWVQTIGPDIVLSLVPGTPVSNRHHNGGTSAEVEQ